MEIFLFWFGFSLVVGVIASGRGRSFWGYAFLAMLLSPLIGLVIVLVSGHARKCPKCKGGVDQDATKCKHCGSDLTAEATEPAAGAS